MAFSDYKNVAQVQKEFGITYIEDALLITDEVAPSPTFVQEIAFTFDNIDVYTSEASRAEAIIFPVLREVYKGYYDRYSLWIQKPMVWDEKLNGTPDYIVGAKSVLGKTVMETPLVIIVEAKKNDFEQGWGQCLAELVAAQKINGEKTGVVFGIVTDGKLWEFGRLHKVQFTKNREGFTVDQLGRLLGILHYIFRATSDHLRS